MGVMYSVAFSGVTVSAAQDLFELVPPTNQSCALAGLKLWQTTDVQDAEEEILDILIKTGQSTSGSGGSTPTPNPLKTQRSAASVFTAEANNTTKASTGTIVTRDGFGWNVRMPLELWIPEEYRVEFDTSDNRLTVELVGAPADALTMSGIAFVEQN